MKGGKREGAGRKPNVPNKNTQELRDMILCALDGAGGVKYLQTCAKQNPGPFLSLISKVLPQNINASVSFDIGAAVEEAKERLRARGESV